MTRRIDYVPLDDVRGADRNAKTHRVDLVARSIGRHGYTAPAVLDERTGRLVAGHGRVEALRALRDDGEPAPGGVRVDAGTWLVPVVRGWASKDDVHAAAVVVADNQLTIRGGWDETALADLLREITAADPMLSATTGFTAEEITELLAGHAPGPGPVGDGAEDHLVVPDEPVTVPGQTWLLGEHRITCGDATDRAVWDRLFDGTSPARAIWTDPPYGLDYVGKTAKRLPVYNDAPDGAIPLFADALDALAPHLVDGAAVYVAHPPSGLLGMQFAEVLGEPPFRLLQQLVWVKDAFILGRSDYHYRQEAIYYAVHGLADPRWYGGNAADSVFEFGRPNASVHHPTIKPWMLVAAHLRNSTAPGDVVAEPFTGSGSTLVACERAHLTFRGTELHPGYVDVAAARWQGITGRWPVDAVTGEPVDFGDLAGQMAAYKDAA